MARTAAEKRRIRRLAVVGTVWAFVLLNAVPALVAAVLPKPGCGPSGADAPEGSGRRAEPGTLFWSGPTSGPSVGGTICVEHGRLPAKLPEPSSESRVDDLLGRVASGLAHRKATVFCPSAADWADEADQWEANWPQLGPLGPWRAFTAPDPPWPITLSPTLCVELTRLARLHRPVWRDDYPDALAWAVGALAHEAVHATGNADEVEATCFGMQTIRDVARGLGRTRREGEYLTTLFWKHWYRWLDTRSRDCRNGGPLDLRPRTDVWP